MGKMPKDLLFREECLLKLQTPMPHNKKEKRKRNFFSENWGITVTIGHPTEHRAVV
jgi:hypothetical protein